MMSSSQRSPAHRCVPRPPRRGVVMPIMLIALLLLLIGVAAMLRGIDAGSTTVGNIAFRRDLTNRAEIAIAAAKAALATGALASESARVSDLASANYSASRLTSTNGVPDALLKDSTYNTTYSCLPVSSCASDPGADQVKIRWLIDRQCTASGAFDSAKCEFSMSTGDSGGSSWLRKPQGSARPVYRISVRITGPRNIEAYYQTSYVD